VRTDGTVEGRGPGSMPSAPTRRTALMTWWPPRRPRTRATEPRTGRAPGRRARLV